MLQEVNLMIIYSIDCEQTESSLTGGRILQRDKSEPQGLIVYHRFLAGGVEVLGDVFSYYSAWGMPLMLSLWKSGKQNILYYERSSAEQRVFYPSPGIALK